MKVFSTLLLSLFFSAVTYAVPPAAPPSALKFAISGTTTPTVGDCLDVLALTSSGVTATDAGAPCGTGAGSVSSVTVNSPNSTITVTNPTVTSTGTISVDVAAPPLKGTSTSIGGGALLAGACATTTVAIVGATTAMSVGSAPVTYPGAGNYWQAWVSSAGTVTVAVCAAVAGTPTASTYNLRVIP
jgi:hypothetical protein